MQSITNSPRQIKRFLQQSLKEREKKKKEVGREPKIKETLETILIYGPYLKPVQINKL